MRQMDGERSAVAERRPPDLSAFEGTWRSSDRATRGVTALALETAGGTLRARIYGAGPDGEIAWGETAAVPYTDGVASDTGAGFVADYDFGTTRGRVQANLKLGVAVLGVYRSFGDGSDRRNYFFREFLARSPVPPAASAGQGPIDAGPLPILCRQDLDFGTYAERGAVDPTVLLGRWRATQPRSQGIVGIDVEPGHAGGRGGVDLRLRGAHPDGPIDWGVTPGEVYACVEEDDVTSACALGRYDFGFMTSELQVRQNKGILALTTFNRFADGSGRRDYVVRELFHR